MAPPQQGGQGGDNWAGMIWTVVAIFATIGIIWYLYKDQIVYGFLTVKLYEVSALSAVTDYFRIMPGYFDQIKLALVQARASVGGLAFPDIISLGSAAGAWLRYPLIAILIAMAFAVYFGNATAVFRRTYSMRDLAKLEKDNWPQIMPVINLDLVKTDIDTGPWSMAMNPMQFCKRYKLLEEVRAPRSEGSLRKDWERIDVILKRGEAMRLFAMQLGPVWRGVEALPPHVKALFAAFIARINADTKPAQDLLLQLNRTCLTKLDISGADELIKKHLNTKLVQQRLQNHAYILTVMASMLEGAREDGVQASADFLWLKPLDRKLWYTLNTVGRQTPFIEVAGVFSHWIAEKEAGHKLLMPMVDGAVNATELALKEVLYKRDEE